MSSQQDSQPSEIETEPEMSDAVTEACDNYVQYLRLILRPAMRELEMSMDARNLRLHQVFGANLYLAHAVDYILRIREAAGLGGKRKKFLSEFDTLYSVEGARFGNKKFELIDAINNALKHIRLDPIRYKHLEEQYGSISFQSLVEQEGEVFCILDGYRFDYARVVIRPAWNALNSWHLEGTEDVLAFACETEDQWAQAEQVSASDCDDPIDAMIEHQNPVCDDCEEYEGDCRCSQYVYEGEKGEFVPRFRGSFDFDEVMSRISGAYRRERD